MFVAESKSLMSVTMLIWVLFFVIFATNHLFLENQNMTYLLDKIRKKYIYFFSF